MSQEIVEIVKRVVENFIATDRLTDEVAADFIWDMSTFRGWPDQPAFHGFDGFTEFTDAWREPYDDWSMASSNSLMAVATRWLICGRALSMMARSRRTRSLKSSTQPSSSVTGCELGMSDIAPRSVAKKPGIWRRAGSTGGAGCGSI